QHYIIEYNTRMGTLPGFVEGFSNVARDEHRHIAFGVRILTDMVRDDPRHRAAMQRTMAEALPVADQVLDPPWPEEEDSELFGAPREEADACPAQSPTRRLKVVGRAGVQADGLGPFHRPGGAQARPMPLSRRVSDSRSARPVQPIG